MDIITLGITIIAIVLGIAIFMMYKTLQSVQGQLTQMREIDQNKDNSVMVNLNQRVDNLSKHVSDSLQQVTSTITRQMSESTKQVDTRLHSSNREWMQSAQDIRNTINKNIETIRDVTGKLSQMDESNKRIFEVGKDIASLQEILKAPKLRGTLGELFLGDLLAQIFPKNRYQMQYTFKSGESVDAVIFLRDGHIVPIDAKYPLESFQRLINTDDKEEKKVAKREFKNSIKKRIDEIATKYILTDEGTLDFALMYIPAENVYYETIIKGDEGFDVMTYAYSKRVIPVSPNNLYVYLQTIAMGLRGMQIEERAREILADLSRLNTDFGKVTDSYEVLGKHLNSATSRYEETTRLLGKFGTRVEQIEEKTDTSKPLESGTSEVADDSPTIASLDQPKIPGV